MRPPIIIIITPPRSNAVSSLESSQTSETHDFQKSEEAINFLNSLDNQTV